MKEPTVPLVYDFEARLWDTLLAAPRWQPPPLLQQVYPTDRGQGDCTSPSWNSTSPQSPKHYLFSDLFMFNGGGKLHCYLLPHLLQASS